MYGEVYSRWLCLCGMIGIASDSAAVSTSLNDFGSCPDKSSSVPVSSSDVGNVKSVNTVSSCTHNSTSTDTVSTSLFVVSDIKTDDGQRAAVTSVSAADTTPPVGEGSKDAAQVGVGSEPLEVTPDTDLAAAALTSAADGQNVYHVKWIKFRGSQTPIVMQNQNGPCPLLAIVNVLLLQGKVKLPSSADLVASDQLMAYIADWIFDNVPKVCNFLTVIFSDLNAVHTVIVLCLHYITRSHYNGCVRP